MKQEEINAVADKHLPFFRGVLIHLIHNEVAHLPEPLQAPVAEALTSARLHALMSDPHWQEASFRVMAVAERFRPPPTPDAAAVGRALWQGFIETLFSDPAFRRLRGLDGSDQ